MLKFSRFSPRQLLFTIVVAGIALLDPFGISSSTDEASATWLNRLLAGNYSDAGQQQVVVILLDDAYLLRNQTYWPMPYNEQAKLFKRLLAYKPQAVFADLLYTHDHSRNLPGQTPGTQSQLLANVFERYQRQGIPLFLANNGHAAGDGSVNTLARFSQVSTPALVSWSGHGSQYPLATQTGLGLMETPALKLYREYCRTRACTSLPPDAAAAAQEPDIAVQWGLHPHPLQPQASDIVCKLPGLGRQLMQAVFWKFDKDDGPSNCTYTLTIPASALEVTESEDRQLLRQMLEGKLVLVGAKITGTDDITLSPLYGNVPGVYLHAMALDNLVTWGMDYYRSMPTLGEVGFVGKIDLLDCFELALLALIAHLKGTLDAPLFTRSLMKQQRRPRSAPLASWVLVTGLLALLSAGLWLFNYTPANVFGLLLLSLTLFSTRLQALFTPRA